MYRHIKISHDLLFGDLEKYDKLRDEVNNKIKIGMKIKCKNNKIGTVIDIKSKFIIYKNDNDKISSCKFNEYEIIDSKYEKYQKYISDLKNKLKIGVKVKFNNYYGPIIKINNNRIYFRDDKTSNIIWCIIDIIKIY